jgi:DNA repair exonuclease SbcCD ATPase subunit
LQKQIGDEIIACNGLSLDGISQEEASDIIRGAAWPLTLKLRRQQLESSANPLLSLEDDDSSVSPLVPHTVILTERVRDINKLTSDIEEISSKLDTHNCMRQQAAVMTIGIVERVPSLLDKLHVLKTAVEETKTRLEKLKEQNSERINTSSAPESI